MLDLLYLVRGYRNISFKDKVILSKNQKIHSEFITAPLHTSLTIYTILHAPGEQKLKALTREIINFKHSCKGELCFSTSSLKF